MTRMAPLQQTLGLLSRPSAVMIATTGAGSVLRLVSSILLTRLLVPADFGLATLVSSIFYAVTMISDVGFYTYVVRHERGDETHFVDAVWSLHAARGFLLTLVSLVLAWPAASLLGKPALAPLVAAASVTFILEGVGSFSTVLAVRHGQVRRLSIFDLGVSIVQIVSQIALALLLKSVWAIILGMIIGSAVRCILSYIIFKSRMFRLLYDPSVAADLWRFSRPIMLSSFLTLCLSQTDKLVLARLMSLSEFGVYAIAANLAFVPVVLASTYCTRILYPMFAADWRAHGLSQLRVSFYRGRGTVFFSYLLATGGLIGAAPFAVRLLYDPRYYGAGYILSLLAITPTLNILNHSMVEMLNAIGKTGSQLVMNFGRMAWLISAGILGYRAAGALGLIMAVATIEVPAYLIGALKLRRLRVLSVRREALAFAVIALGVAGGFVARTVLLAIFPNL